MQLKCIYSIWDTKKCYFGPKYISFFFSKGQYISIFFFDFFFFNFFFIYFWIFLQFQHLYSLQNMKIHCKTWNLKRVCSVILYFTHKIQKKLKKNSKNGKISKSAAFCRSCYILFQNSNGHQKVLFWRKLHFFVRYILIAIPW